MTEKQAVHYGQVEIIPGIKCDGYVLDDGIACLSERGAADLLGMKQASFQSVTVNWPPKTLEPFIDKAQSVTVNSVKVVAKNSPHKGRNITVYDSIFIENLIRGYSLALASHSLKKTQIHIGDRCVTLACSLIRTALETAIKEACGIPTNVQATAQKNYTDIVELMKESGLKCSVNDEIAIKTDITDFLDLKQSTLNSFLGKHRNTILPIKLDRATIRALGSKASRLNGYHVQDVGTIALGMDSVVGIGLKEKMFGSVSSLAKLDTKGEIEWQQILAEIFAGFSFYHNYQIGSYRVDFYVKELDLILECNGYDSHANYNQTYEIEREQFFNNYRVVRFHHQVDLKTLFNSILRAKMGTITKLYNYVYPETSKSSATELNLS
jgi:very-short-patch-repair endonuclease